MDERAREIIDAAQAVNAAITWKPPGRTSVARVYNTERLTRALRRLQDALRDE